MYCYSLFFHLIQDDTLLVIGWGTSVKIASIRANQSNGTNGTYRNVSKSSMNQVDIVASFQTSYFISGVAPFGDSLVVLAYIPGEEDGEKEFSSTIPSRQVFSPSFLWKMWTPIIMNSSSCKLNFVSFLFRTSIKAQMQNERSSCCICGLLPPVIVFL